MVESTDKEKEGEHCCFRLNKNRAVQFFYYNYYNNYINIWEVEKKGCLFGDHDSRKKTHEWVAKSVNCMEGFCKQNNACV